MSGRTKTPAGSDGLREVRGVRLTLLRQRVLTVLEEAGEPVKAYAILEALRQPAARPIPPGQRLSGAGFFAAARSGPQAGNAQRLCGLYARLCGPKHARVFAGLRPLSPESRSAQPCLVHDY